MQNAYVTYRLILTINLMCSFEGQLNNCQGRIYLQCVGLDNFPLDYLIYTIVNESTAFSW